MHGAATHPDRVAGLILFHPAARYRLDADYPIGIDDQTWEHWKSYMADWDVDTLLSVSYPSRAGDDRFMQWGRRYIRSMATPAAMLAYVEASWHTDVRDLLPLIEVPTLVMNRRDGQWASGEMARFVAEHIPGAQYREFPGGDSDIFFEESSSIVDAMTTFIAEIGPVGASSAPSERMMATILFTDIVASTERAQSSGDSDWSRLLQVHDDLSADIVNRHSGRLVKSTGDGILALFDGPGRGLVAARDLCAAMNGIGLPIRAGLHAGEVEIRGDDVAGIGVNIASRVMAAAGPDAILVSRTVRDLVAGSQFRFDSRGSHELKGVDGEWELWALVGG
jgi:class 3 adenylate cyclase